MAKIKEQFEAELADLRIRLMEMGLATEEALAEAIRALTSQDMALVEEVVQQRVQIETWDVEIETACLRLMAARIHDARNRRLIGATLKIVTHLEGIADHAVDIARVAQRMSNEAIYKPLIDVPQLGTLARQMLRDALTAFLSTDLARAQGVVVSDDRADALYGRMRRELAAVLQRDPDSVIQASYLLFVAHYLERACDHATRIAARVEFLETGHLRPEAGGEQD